jgi:hypothetical protein
VPNSFKFTVPKWIEIKYYAVSPELISDFPTNVQLLSFSEVFVNDENIREFTIDPSKAGVIYDESAKTWISVPK